MIVLILTTVPDSECGDAISRALVEERLAACVNVYPPMVSHYRWDCALNRDIEHQMVIKTTTERVSAVQARVHDLHPYELPEFLVLPTQGGSAAYVEWVRGETGGSDSERTR